MPVQKLATLTESWTITVPESVSDLRNRLKQSIQPRPILEFRTSLGHSGNVTDDGFVIHRLAASNFSLRRSSMTVTGIFREHNDGTEVAMRLTESRPVRFFAWLLLFLAVAAPVSAFADPESNQPMPGLPELSPLAHSGVCFLIMFSIYIVFTVSVFAQLSHVRGKITALVTGPR